MSDDSQTPVPAPAPHPDGFGGARDARILAETGGGAEWKAGMPCPKEVLVQAVRGNLDLLHRAGFPVMRQRKHIFYPVVVTVDRFNRLQLAPRA